MLYKKRKFDIRCYMVITAHNLHLRAFWYREGYIRTSSVEFSNSNPENLLMHLTNDAVQKKSHLYGKYEQGNKVSYAEFEKYLKDTN